MKWITFLSLLYVYADGQSAGDYVDLIPEGTSNGAKANQKVDDDKKTLSQQVAEGRYGLIPNEIFKTPIARPGIVSYESNSEVPSDNIDNLGGLNESDIWLAENHLLVLRGGVLSVLDNAPDYAASPVWPPIDDYKAPKRPVKIPNNPKVPPPFPVQLREGGPIQILGTNFTRTLNESSYPYQYPIPPLDGYDPGNAPFFPPPYQNSPNFIPGKAPFPDTPFITPIQGGNQSGYGPSLKFPIGNKIPPIFDSLPPGTSVVSPNITEDYDEDDLSIYYPPPYSFYYEKENVSAVPPGPLVPGIVLPPPPNFFSPLQKPTGAPSVTTLGNQMRNTTTIIPTPVYIKPTLPTHFSMRIPQVRNKTVSVTILRPIKTTKKPTPQYVPKPFEVYGPPPIPKVTVQTTKVPLKSYFTETDANLVSLLEKDHRTTKSSLRKTPPPPQIYYYDDTPATNLVTPFPSNHQILLRNLSDFYVEPPKVSRVRSHNRYYLPAQEPLQVRTNSFNTHIAQLQDEIEKTRPRIRPQTPKPVYQYSFEVSNYKEQHEKLHPAYHPQVEIQPAIEVSTPPPVYQNRPLPIYVRPHFDYSPPVTPNPVYDQYYTKQDERGLDDITKTYFTTFGKKLPASTTPLPPPRRLPPKRPSADAIVNYLKRPLQVDYIGAYHQEQDYRRKIPPNVQTIQAIQVPLRTTLRETQAGSFISYELPGDDGAHFYFLTPQLTNYYQQTADSRIRQQREA
ncbi:proline-rich extensin-like protein EPR1 [Photinus pyralis]|uniref:DUF4794 domain-containing protein n=1 Tax=Photinus pyralis TaxID=7054 RepID=A0A1Y1L6F4_PHOPY|nr:proline-rich extensin-like protein EPR1 [Photinus pyralis]XP_031346510.1 proline-rich extensin-like protein EPR1 [Photinus pyralis]XP_031346511.1 proline-rich extensin-like protein EPR1 [Photinus pyralis]